MALPSLSLSQFQSLFFTQYSAVAAIPANTDQGSSCWALGNAVALLALNVQQELQYVQSIARLGSSVSTTPGINSPNVDTFVAPFGIMRVAATYATGAVTMTAPSIATAQIVIPVGGQVSTATGIVFNVIADPTNTNYSPSLNGYPINIGSSSTTVTVQCVIGGIAGNVQAGQISTLVNSLSAPPITGIGTVNNAAAFTSGSNQESDTALQTRFQAAMSTGVVGTDNALVAAALAVAPGTVTGVPGLTYSLGDGLNSSGSATSAVVSFYANNYGTGVAPSSALITEIQNAIRSVAAGGIIATAYAPTIVPVNVSATVHVPTGLNAATVITNCVNAYNRLINTIGLNPAGGSTQVDYFAVAASLLAVANVTKVDALLTGENGFTPVNGTSTGTSATTLTDSTQTWTVNAYAGDTVSSAGSFAVISSNTATAVTIAAWIGPTPPVGNSYSITSTPAGTTDLTATFGNQFVAGAASFTAAQP